MSPQTWSCFGGGSIEAIPWCHLVSAQFVRKKELSANALFTRWIRLDVTAINHPCYNRQSMVVINFWRLAQGQSKKCFLVCHSLAICAHAYKLICAYPLAAIAAYFPSFAQTKDAKRWCNLELLLLSLWLAANLRFVDEPEPSPVVFPIRYFSTSARYVRPCLLRLMYSFVQGVQSWTWAGLCSNTGRVYFAVANHLDIDEISDKALFMYKTSTILMSRGGPAFHLYFLLYIANISPHIVFLH